MIPFSRQEIESLKGITDGGRIRFVMLMLQLPQPEPAATRDWAFRPACFQPDNPDSPAFVFPQTQFYSPSSDASLQETTQRIFDLMTAFTVMGVDVEYQVIFGEAELFNPEVPVNKLANKQLLAYSRNVVPLKDFPVTLVKAQHALQEELDTEHARLQRQRQEAENLPQTDQQPIFQPCPACGKCEVTFDHGLFTCHKCGAAYKLTYSISGAPYVSLG